MKNNIYCADTSGVGFHVFLNINADAFQIDFKVISFDAHNSEHTGAERSGHNISRRESFTFPMIIGGRIGFNKRLALLMRGSGT